MNSLETRNASRETTLLQIIVLNVSYLIRSNLENYNGITDVCSLMNANAHAVDEMGKKQNDNLRKELTRVFETGNGY